MSNEETQDADEARAYYESVAAQQQVRWSVALGGWSRGGGRCIREGAGLSGALPWLGPACVA